MMKRFTLIELIVFIIAMSLLLAIGIKSCSNTVRVITQEEKKEKGSSVKRISSHGYPVGIVYVVEYEGELYLVNDQGGIVHHQKGEAKSHESDR